jgi:hypothetical protein
MTYGFEALNNNNQVLVSSETRNLHFVQKLYEPRNFTVSATDLDAGIIYSTNMYGGIRRWRYTATCAVTPVPFFTMPTNDFYGILRIVNKGNSRWDIEIFRSGTSDTWPQLYIFADPRASTATETHGMVVYRDDGTPSFDSRLRPLVVNAGVTVTHPSNPRTVYNKPDDAGFAVTCNQQYSDLGYIFNPDASTGYIMDAIPGSTRPRKPIFTFLSIAQSQRQFTATAYENVKAYDFGFERTIDNRYWTSNYWEFYRGAIRNPVSTTGLHTFSTDTTATVVGTPVYNFNTTASIFYNGYGGNTTNWYNTGNRSGDDGLWLIALEWPIQFTNREGTGQTTYNVMLLSTNGYITFNYQNSDGSYRDPDAGSFIYSDLAVPNTLAAARIMVYAADNSANKMGITQFGTAPNRTNVIRYYGFPDTSSWYNTPNAHSLVWEIQFPENKPDEMYIVFPNGTINAKAGAVLGVGTASGWQDIETRAASGVFTPRNLVIKRGRSVSDYQSSPVIEAGWGGHDYGCNYNYYASGGGGFFGFLGASTAAASGGVWPYSNETLNLTNNTVIVADGSKYD